MRKNSRNIELLKKILLEYRGSFAGLLVHRNADPDALASAITLSRFLDDLKIENYLFLPEGVNRVAKNMLDTLNINIDLYDMVMLKNMVDNIDFFIILDTSNPIQLGEAYRYIRGKPLILIDHHIPGSLVKKASVYYVEKLVSTSELVYILLRDIWVFSQDLATLLLAGILYDSKRFTYVDPVIFLIVHELINVWKANYLLAISSLKKTLEIPERIARLKASKRMTIFRTDDLLIVFTRVGSYESNVANAILELGAHAVFVASEKRKGKVRITGRATQEFINRTSLSLGGIILRELAKKLNGEGGGHDTAGVVEYSGDVEKGYHMLIELLKEKLGPITILRP